MQPDPTNLLAIAEISNPLVGFYDTPETIGFAPLVDARQCIFACYPDWMRGARTCLTERNIENIGCPGAGYWNCNVASMPREEVARHLAEKEGLKASSELMCQWLVNRPPYQREHAHVVIGPLQEEYYGYLKTITFYVNPDQLSLLITGAEYGNASTDNHPVTAVFASGCGQLAAVFDDFDAPQAVIGGTDIAMRPYLPRDTLAFTVTKSMFEQLCRLDRSSFLYQSFWTRVKRSRNQSGPIQEETQHDNQRL